jgi:anaerobic magnesium-protoporphyrin IX monomethyl ester cyclase
MKVYSLNPPFIPNFVRCGRWQGAAARGGTLYYPIWLAYTTGVLEREFGRRVRLVDAPAWKWSREQVIEDCAKFKPDLLVIDTNFSSLTNDMEVACDLKKNAESSKVILVGPPCSQFAERILANKEIDAVARFEYDLTVLECAKAIEGGESFKTVLGLSYNEDGRVMHNADRSYIRSEELDTIPFVSKVYKDHLNINDYFLGHTLHPMVQLIAGRGCPNRCTFCAWPVTFTGRSYRVRSVENVVDEMEFVSNELPQVREIFFEDDTFTIQKKRIDAICREIKKRDLGVTWSCNARANLDYESMRLMKQAGCRLLDVGYESGNDDMLKKMKKGITTADSRRFTRDAKRAGLMILADIILGMPGETKETAEQTLKFVKELKPNIVQYSIATPIPGTEFYGWAKDNKYLLVDDLKESLDKDGFQKCIVSYPEFTSEDVAHYVDKGLKEYYLSPTYLPILLRNVLRKNGLHELLNLVRSAKTFIGYIGRKDA